MRRTVSLAPGLAFASLAFCLQAAESDFKLDAELDLGMEYDSNLTVEELDRSTSTSDTALLLRGKLDGQWQASDKLSLRGGYSYLSRNYRDHSEFDLAIHQLYGDLSYEFEPATLGASHHYARARLDGSDLLDLHQTSLYASRLFDQRIFLRLAADFRDKQFDDRDARDAQSEGLSSDVYVFFNRARTYVSAGISGESEDAKGAEFDYDGWTLKSKVSHKFPLAEKTTQLSLAYRFEDRQYDHLHPLIGNERDDTRHTAKLEWEVGLNDHVAVISSLEYRDFHSNLESVDYTKNLASLALRLKL